ncbi:MAG TPA: hypothetical protein VFN35_01955 [Ktedonobacteraceae bacterium]|nr:hypothetical protein [Ktedonobacteraceae bacterium]
MVDPDFVRLNKFKDGIGAALVGVTEQASFLDPSQIKAYGIRSLPFSMNEDELSQRYIDSYGLNPNLDPEHGKLGIDFINMATEDEVISECLDIESGSLNPQFLVPTKPEILKRFARKYPLYEDIEQLADLSLVAPICLSADSYSWFTRSPISSDIRKRIAGPLSEEHQFDLTQVSDDPLVPANLADKW